MHRPDDLKRDEPLLWSPGTGTEVWRMFCAAMNGDVAAIEALLDGNASLVRCQYSYLGPLDFAVRENQIAAATFLLDRGADPIGLCIQGSLVESRPRPRVIRRWKIARIQAGRPSQRFSPRRTDRRGHSRARFSPVRACSTPRPGLLHTGDKRSNQPIHWAVMTRQIELIDELLARGADINARRCDGARPIQLTNGDYHFRGWRDVPDERRGHPRGSSRAPPWPRAYHDICTAAELGDLERVRELLDQEPSLANRVSEYVTLLYRLRAPSENAAARGHLEIVSCCSIAAPIRICARRASRPAAMRSDSAVYHGHFEIARLLLEHGAFPQPAR